MDEYIGQPQGRMKQNAYQLFLIFLRSLTGFFLGLTIALVGQILFEYGTFALTFVVVTMMALVLKLTQHMTLASILVLDLILILAALLIKAYIHMAPNF